MGTIQKFVDYSSFYFLKVLKIATNSEGVFSYRSKT